MKRPLLIFALCVGLLGCPSSEPTAPPPTAAAQASAQGQTALAAGDLATAKSHFEAAKKAGRNEPHGRLGLAAAALAEGQITEAKAQLTALRNVGLKPAETAPYLTAAIDGAQKSAVEKPEDTPEEAQPKPAVGDPAEKKDVLPSNLSDPEKRQAKMSQQGKYADVVRDLADVESPSPFQLKLLADAHYNMGQWKPAVAVYRQVLARNPLDEAATQYLADSLYRLGRYDDSIRFYRVLAVANPDKPGFWKLVGDAARKKGDLEVALAAYNKALQGGYDKPEVKAAIEALQAKLQDPPEP